MQRILIKNRTILLSGLSEEEHQIRKILLDSLEAAISSVEPRKLVRRCVKLVDSVMNINETKYNLDRFRNIFVIGGGKASGAMAESVNDILKDRIKSGVVNVPSNTASRFKTGRIELNEAGHPVPDERGVEGVKKMLTVVESLDEKDLVICLISGGGSSLLPLPAEGILLKDLQLTTKLLLKSGAHIGELNAVRKHISQIKGGKLAQKLYPAEVISLIISDVVDNSLETIASGLTSPDGTTYQEAVNVLKKYRLWLSTPLSIRKVLNEGAAGIIAETPKPKDSVFRRVRNLIIGSGNIACKTAANNLGRSGLNTLILATHLRGEAIKAGSSLSKMALDVKKSNNPIRAPAAIIAGGETTVAVRGKGIGGRNQEVALSFALNIDGLKGITFASIDTDGIDGASDVAGALVDGTTIARARENSIDAHSLLNDNDSYCFFSTVGGHIFTGPTFTNVNDLAIMIIT